jgi:hypothetical protein
MDDDGFFMGELNGRRGLVPSNFLTDVPSGYVFVDPRTSSLTTTSVQFDSYNLSVEGSIPASSNISNTTANNYSSLHSQQPRILGTQRRW